MFARLGVVQDALPEVSRANQAARRHSCAPCRWLLVLHARCEWWAHPGTSPRGHSKAFKRCFHVNTTLKLFRVLNDTIKKNDIGLKQYFLHIMIFIQKELNTHMEKLNNLMTL